MKDILIQIGHKNTEAMTDERLNPGDAAVLRTYTGAPGEREFAERLAMLLGRQLGELGCRVVIVDCIWHPDIYAHRYDLMLALHYDGGGSDSHAMASEGYRHTTLDATDQGRRFVDYWAEDYERITHIPVKQQLVNANMTHYYGWAYPTMDTPRVLIEHGNGSSAHDWAIMHDHIDWIVEADVLAIKKLFEITEEVTLEEQEYIDYYRSIAPEVAVNTSSGIYQAWREEQKAGRNYGPALENEVPIAGTGGRIRQRFAAKIAIYFGPPVSKVYWY